MAVALILLAAAAVGGWQWWKHRDYPASEPEPVVSKDPGTPSTMPAAPSAPAARTDSPGAQVAALKQEAIGVAQALAETYPNDPLSYALLGSAFFNTGRSEEAVKHLQKCLELSPNMVEAYDILARAAYDRGDPEETVRLCVQALKRGPATPDVANRMGRAQMDLGQTAEAIRTLQQAVRLPGANSESWYLLGQANMQSGDFAKAKEGFLRAVDLVPNHTQAYFGLFTACQRLGQTNEATQYRAEFQKLEAIDRKTLVDRSAQEDTLTGLPSVRETVARTLFGAAQIYRSREQAGKAGELFFRAATLDPESPVYRSALAAHYLRHQVLEEGVAAFQQLTAAQPDNGLNHLYLARLQSQLNQFESAERSLLKAQELSPRLAEGYRSLAELYLQANRKLDQAQLLAEKAAALEPSDSNFYLLAVSSAENNDRVKALEALAKALELAPDNKRYIQLRQQLQQSP